MLRYGLFTVCYGLFTLCYRLFTLRYAMDYSQYAMDYLRIIYDIDVLLSLSQDWVGRGIIFILIILMLLAVHCIAVFYF